MVLALFTLMELTQLTAAASSGVFNALAVAAAPKLIQAVHGVMREKGGFEDSIADALSVDEENVDEGDLNAASSVGPCSANTTGSRPGDGVGAVPITTAESASEAAAASASHSLTLVSPHVSTRGRSASAL